MVFMLYFSYREMCILCEQNTFGLGLWSEVFMDLIFTLGGAIMATKSFLKDITIKNRKSCEALVNALEHAEGKKSKDVVACCKVRIASPKDIKKFFGTDK